MITKLTGIVCRAWGNGCGVVVPRLTDAGPLVQDTEMGAVIAERAGCVVGTLLAQGMALLALLVDAGVVVPGQACAQG